MMKKLLLIIFLFSYLFCFSQGGTSNQSTGGVNLGPSTSLVAGSGITLTKGVKTTTITATNLATGLTGIVPIVNGGTNASTATGSGSVVLQTSPTIITPSITISRQTMGNANATYSATVTQVALTATISASRTLTLPLANSVSSGTELSFVDEIGTITATNNIQVKRAGSNTINGDTMLVFSSPYSFGRFVSDGSSKWTSGSGMTVSSGTWTPTFTGFSVAPTIDNNEYTYIVYPNGTKECHVSFDSYGGTQNATGFTMTLPYAAKKYTVFLCMALDNATGLYARGIINAGSNIITFYSAPSGSGAWAGSGSKWGAFNLTYFVQ